jgi:hypothetical protein
MALIAKMRVDKVTQYGGQTGQASEQVELSAVYSDDPEHPNYEWSQATPSGKLELYIDNPAAFGKIKPGDEVHVTIQKIRASM